MAEATFDIAKAFQNKSIAMQASFLAIREVTKHPTIRGDQSEADCLAVAFGSARGSIRSERGCIW